MIKYSFISVLLLTMLVTACQSNEKREYISWGNESKSAIERLADHKIDYKVEDGIIYIPKDQMSKATSCCT